MGEHMSWVTNWDQWRRALGLANSRQRRNVETFLDRHPAILYWGDSWFSTPLYLNLARQSARHINGFGMINGKPGALAASLFSAGEVARMGDRIANNPFDVVCLSAGGNDCLSDRLARAFRAWTASPGTKPKIGAAEAFDIFLAAGLLDRVSDAYVRVLDRLAKVQAKRPHLRVLGHPYVPIVDIGRPAKLTTSNIGLIAWVKDDTGPWLWEPMRHVLKNRDEAREFARMMLEDGFRDAVLKPLARDYNGLFSIVDFGDVDTSATGFWNDEIHPSEAGFDMLATRFNDALRAALPARKRHAVTG